MSDDELRAAATGVVQTADATMRSGKNLMYLYAPGAKAMAEALLARLPPADGAGGATSAATRTVPSRTKSTDTEEPTP